MSYPIIVRSLTKGGFLMSEHIGKNIFIITNKMKRSLDKKHQKNNIYLGQARILMFLYNTRKDKIYQKDIEEHFQIRAGTVTGMLNALIELELIKRVDSKLDRRKKIIELTNEGIKKAKEAIKTIVEFENGLHNLLSEEERNNLTSIFEKIDNWLNYKEDNDDKTI